MQGQALQRLICPGFKGVKVDRPRLIGATAENVANSFLDCPSNLVVVELVVCNRIFWYEMNTAVAILVWVPNPAERLGMI